jgi:hypothetical protein
MAAPITDMGLTAITVSVIIGRASLTAGMAVISAMDISVVDILAMATAVITDCQPADERPFIMLCRS